MINKDGATFYLESPNNVRVGALRPRWPLRRRGDAIRARTACHSSSLTMRMITRWRSVRL
jgi:hypothetical protein